MTYVKLRFLKRKACAVLALAIVMATLSGCWDRHEVDELGIIGSLALDKGPGGNVLVSLEVLNPSALSSGVGQAGNPIKVVAWVLHDEADTIANALSNAQRRTPRSLSVGQVNTVIWGQALAREGIGRHIDYLLREARFRKSAFLSTCDTGSGLLQRPFMETLPSRSLAGLAMRASVSGKSTMVTLNEFVYKLGEPGVEPITMHTAGRRTKDIQVKRQGEEVKQPNPSVVLDNPLDVDVDPLGELPDDSPVLDPLRQAGTGEPLPPLTIDVGIAAFKGDRMVGLLDGKDARGFLWAVGRVEQADLEIPDPSGQAGQLGLTVIRASSSIKPILNGPLPSMKLQVHVVLELTEVPFAIRTKKEVVDALEGEVNKLVEEEIRSTLAIVQGKLKSDIYGFGRLIWQANPRLWSQLEPVWNDQVFPLVEVEIEVKSRLMGPGSILRD